MTSEEYKAYRETTLIKSHNLMKGSIQFWKDKIERTKKGSHKMQDHFLEEEIRTLKSLENILNSFNYYLKYLYGV